MRVVHRAPNTFEAAMVRTFLAERGIAAETEPPAPRGAVETTTAVLVVDPADVSVATQLIDEAFPAWHAAQRAAARRVDADPADAASEQARASQAQEAAAVREQRRRTLFWIGSVYFALLVVGVLLPRATRWDHPWLRVAALTAYGGVHLAMLVAVWRALRGRR